MMGGTHAEDGGTHAPDGWDTRGRWWDARGGRRVRQGAEEENGWAAVHISPLASSMPW